MLEGCRAKLDRAEAHLVHLESLIRAYRNDCCRIEPKYNVKAGEVTFQAREVKQPPVEISLLAGEILHNLRCPLDYLVSAIVRRRHYTPTHSHAFPISTNAKEFQRESVARLKHVPNTLVTEIEGLQPYNGRTPYQHPLFLLESFNNRDKHSLLPVGYGVVYKGKHLFDPSTLELRRECKSVPLKEGTKLGTYGTLDGSNPRYAKVDVFPAISVFFRHVTTHGQFMPVHESLQAIRSYVEIQVFSNANLTHGFDWKPKRTLDIAPCTAWLPDCL
jgi:hypothetical protein